MYRAKQACIRAVSTMLQRPVIRTSPVACAPEMSTKASSKDAKAPKKSSKSSKADPSPQTKEVPAEPEYKGDSYKSGEEFFTHNAYTFYDVENSVKPHRCPQPSSDKMRYEFCLDKLNPADEPEPRKLLAEDFGDLEEYPNKPVPKKTEKPVPSVMKSRYPVGPPADVYDGNSLRSRIPL